MNSILARTRRALLVGATTALLVATAAAQGGFDWGEALDGEPGFGARPDLRQLEELLRDPQGADLERWVALVRLPFEVELELSLARALDERRGYPDVLEPPRAEPVSPLVRLRELQRDPFGAHLDPGQALAYVRLLTDGRHAVRRELALTAEVELRELRGALALMVAHVRGLAQLDAGLELSLVARRADLAAAHLRQIRDDLIDLHEPLSTRDPAPDETEMQVAAALTRGDSRAVSELNALRSRGLQEAARLRQGLRTTRFAQRERASLAEREQAKVQAAGNSRRMHHLLPENDAFRAVSDEVAAMSHTDRYREAVRLGQEALLLDPLLPELLFQTALAVDFASGRKAAIPYFDRYLALRGVRYYDHTTTEEGDLDAAETYALFRVADFSATGPDRR